MLVVGRVGLRTLSSNLHSTGSSQTRSSIRISLNPKALRPKALNPKPYTLNPVFCKCVSTSRAQEPPFLFSSKHKRTFHKLGRFLVSFKLSLLGLRGSYSTIYFKRLERANLGKERPLRSMTEPEIAGSLSAPKNLKHKTPNPKLLVQPYKTEYKPHKFP